MFWKIYVKKGLHWGDLQSTVFPPQLSGTQNQCDSRFISVSKIRDYANDFSPTQSGDWRWLAGTRKNEGKKSSAYKFSKKICSLIFLAATEDDFLSDPCVQKLKLKSLLGLHQGVLFRRKLREGQPPRH